MKIQEELNAVEAAYRSKCPDDFLLFIRGLNIPSGKGMQVFDSCMADFQREVFADLAPSLDAVRKGEMPPKRRFWLERTKKASKDGDCAASLLWLVAFPIRPLFIQVGAADRDQAAIVKRRAADILFYNSWLNEHVTIQSNMIKHNGGMASIEIVAADVAGSHGETPDVLIVNELTHVTKWEFVENLMDNADGVPRGLVIVMTNAGYKGTKAAVFRDVAVNSPDWSVHLWQQPAPWHNPASIADAKKRNTKSRFMRLWYGKWASGKGDAFDESDIDRIFKPGLKQLQKPEDGWRYVAGLDLGISHDHAGLAVAGINEQLRKIRIVWMRGFEPSETTGEVDLIEVENVCRSMHKIFRFEWLGYDPHQAVLMAQRLRRANIRMVQVAFTGNNLTTMAETLKTVIETHTLESYEDPDGRLRRDFGKFNIVEKSYGYKLEATSDEYGHADVGTAVAILLPCAVEMLDGKIGLLPTDEIAVFDEKPLEKSELDELPQELRDIYEAYDDIEEDHHMSKRDRISDFLE